LSAADQNPTIRIALSGIFAAFCLITLFLATILPTNRLIFYGLSSVFCALIIIEHDIKAGILFYFATMLLALLLIPNKLRLIPYIFILGHYPIWKTWIEKINHPLQEVFLKLLVLNICTGIAYYLVTSFLLIDLVIPIDLRLIFVLLQVIFFLYDYTFTLIISFYLKRIRKILN
jgi:hypothetical protein